MRIPLDRRNRHLRPKKIPSTFEVWLIQLRDTFPACKKSFNNPNPPVYPCLDCDACGTIYDPKDPPDCYEGNKSRRRIDCPQCNGTGRSNRSTLMRAYKRLRDRYFKFARNWREKHALFVSAWKKLLGSGVTADELESLGFNPQDFLSEKELAKTP